MSTKIFIKIGTTNAHFAKIGVISFDQIKYEVEEYDNQILVFTKIFLHLAMFMFVCEGLLLVF